MILSSFKRFRLPYKATLWTLFLLLFALSSTTAQAAKSNFFNENSNNLKIEIALVQEQGKKALLIFYSTPDCPFCKRMKETVLSQPEIKKFFQTHFHLLEMNILQEHPIKNFSGKLTTAKQFAKQSHIRVTPTLIFYDTAGERLFKQVGIIADPKSFRWLGEYILEEGYSRESFRHYLQKKRNSH